MANSLDKFRKGVAQWSGNIGSAGISDAVVKTVPLASTSGLPTDTAVMITVNRVDANGKKTGNYEGIVGVVSGSNLIDCIRGVEGTAQAWTGGTVVEVLHTASNINELIDGILAEHNQDGTHTDALVTSLKASGAEINTGTEDAKIVTPKAIADSNYIQNKDGWISANETWTYKSGTEITVPSGAASKYAKGDKIKLTQTTVKYFYIIGVADTVLTITGGSSYTLTNAAISANYYSHASSPIGFPSYFSYTPVLSAAGGTIPVFTTNIGFFNIVGTLCHFNFNFSGDGGTDGSGTDDLKISTPVTHLQIDGMLGTIGWYGTGTSEDEGIIVWSSSTLIAPRKSITIPLTSGEFPNGERWLYGECTLYI